MTAPEFVAALEARGVTLSREGNELRIDAPKGVITESIRRALIEQKDAILRVLCDREAESEGKTEHPEEYSAQNTDVPRIAQYESPEYLATNNAAPEMRQNATKSSASSTPLTPSRDAVAGLDLVSAYLLLVSPDDAISAVREAWRAALAGEMPARQESDGVRIPSGSRYGHWTITPANSLLHAFAGCALLAHEHGAGWFEIPEAHHHIGTALAIAGWWRERQGGTPLTGFDLPWQHQIYDGEPEESVVGEAEEGDEPWA